LTTTDALLCLPQLKRLVDSPFDKSIDVHGFGKEESNELPGASTSQLTMMLLLFMLL